MTEGIIKRVYKGRLAQIVPKTIGPELLKQFYDDAGQYGNDKTKYNIFKQFY